MILFILDSVLTLTGGKKSLGDKLKIVDWAVILITIFLIFSVFFYAHYFENIIMMCFGGDRHDVCNMHKNK